MNENATRALDAAIRGLRAARKQIEDVIAEKEFQQKPFDRERREKARVNRKLTKLRRRRAMVAASRVVVPAPKPAEIKAVVATIREVERLALADAMRKAGIDLVMKVVSESSALAGKVG